jgi:beta-glucosidase
MRPDKKVNFRIQNLSDVRVSEVVQVYQKNKASQNEVRNSSLCGFTRVTLEPKQVLCGEIELSPWAFTVVNQQGERIQDGSEYNLWVGTHGPDALSCELAGNAVIECHVDLN